MKFSGKVAVVTGAAKGIGRSVAVLFAKSGAKVAVVDIDETEDANTAADIISAGGDARFIRCDVGVRIGYSSDDCGGHANLRHH